MFLKNSKLITSVSLLGSFVGGVVLFKEFAGGKNYEGAEDLTGKTVVITGANTGIGKQTALAMAQRNAKVIMACRNMEKCFEARRDIFFDSRSRNVHCEECDLASFDSIRQFAKKMNETEERIDILVNNAGVMRCPKSFTKEGVELQLGVNHMGHFLLTNLLLDKIKSCSPSRIVNVSSVAHTRGEINFSDLNSEKSYDEANAYSQSKLANILFTRQLSKILEGTAVTCNAVHPGIVNTELGRHMSISKSLIAMFFAQPFIWLFLKNSRQGAQTTLYVALSPELEKVTGKYFSNQAEADVSEAAKDDESAKRLWAISEKWTKMYEI